MISKKHKTIFIHIEKTAGTSIENKLGLFKVLKRGIQDHRKLRHLERIANSSYSINGLKYAIYCLRRLKFKSAIIYVKYIFSPELTRKEFDSFYKFTFVRNTWSRIFSFYYNVLKDDTLRRNFGIEKDCTLYEFILNKLDPLAFGQLNYLSDLKGVIAVDFIGRYENLESDFQKVCNDLNIEDSRLPELLMVKNKENYILSYDTKTKDLVYKLYKNEIDYFNFKFGKE